MKRQTASQRVTVFYSYAQEDKDLRQRLERHLSLLEREGRIHQWHDHLIPAGTERIQAIHQALDEASIVLLLISPDFLASRQCWEVEMFHALRYHRRGTACVIPIILRPCDWQNAPFARLECLPRDGKAVTEWSDHDAALSDIARDLRQVLDACTWTPQRSSTAKRACLACFLLCSLLANAAQLRFHSHGKWFNLVLFGVIGMLFKICSVNGCVYNTSLFLSRSSYCLKGFDSYRSHI